MEIKHRGKRDFKILWLSFSDMACTSLKLSNKHTYVI